MKNWDFNLSNRTITSWLWKERDQMPLIAVTASNEPSASGAASEM